MVFLPTLPVVPGLAEQVVNDHVVAVAKMTNDGEMREESHGQPY